VPPFQAVINPLGARREAQRTVGSEWWTAVNDSIINRLMPELATEHGAGC
jgi:hypothetical protein